MLASKGRVKMQNDSEAQGPGILDLVIVLVRHIRLLTLAPMTVGIIAFAAAALKPPSYTSEAILSMAENTSRQASAMMATPLVLDMVIGKLQLAREMSLDEARETLQSRLRTKVGKNGLLWVMVTAQSPERAQLLANSLIEAWRMTTVPGQQEQEELLERLMYIQKMLKSVDALLARLTSESPAYFDGQLTRGDRGLTLVSLGELQAKYFNESQSIPRTLQGVSRDVVKQQPSIAVRPDPAGKTKAAVLLAFVTFLLLLIGLLLWHIVTRSLRAPSNAASVARLRAALGWGKTVTPVRTATPGG